MSMKHNGLAKLGEESGELQQVAGKLLQYPNLQYTREETHPDGNVLLDKLEEEMGDVLAACYFVAKKLNLDQSKIIQRREVKVALFNSWDKEVDEP